MIYPAHSSEAQLARLQQAYAGQRSAYAQAPYPALATRKHNLLQLEKLLLDNQQRIADAIRADFGNRSEHETRLLEIFASVEGLRHTRKHLRSWSKALAAGGTVVPAGAGQGDTTAARRGWHHCAVELPGIFSVGPLTAALAAGNRAVVKMSEFTPHTGELFASLIGEYFDEQTISVINGGADVAAKSPPGVGSSAVYRLDRRRPARDARRSRKPDTCHLELGGKSPTIIGPDYPIDAAAASILYGSAWNAGQTCVATGLRAAAGRQSRRVPAAARESVAKLYPTMAANGDYTAIINQRHLQRLQGIWPRQRSRVRTWCR